MADGIKGTVTRIVPEDDMYPPRVFFRPVDLAALRNIDGSKRAGHDEVIVVDKNVAGGVTAFKVGDGCVYDVATGKLTAAAAAPASDSKTEEKQPAA